MTVPRVRTGLVSLLLVVTTVVWRRGDIFSGSLDPVVVSKGALSVLALGLAWLMVASRRSSSRRLGTGTLWVLVVLLTASLLGALGHGTLVATGVIVVRLVILTATVVLVLRVVPALQFLASIVWACAVVAAVAAVTGLPSSSGGRLFGGVPPLNPNELALLAGIVLLWTAWRTVLGEARWRNALVAGASLGVLWLTESRTALLTVLAGVAVMALQLRRARVGLVVGALVVGALGSLGAVLTGAVAGFLSRDGAGTSTLESRFIAWSAARSWAESAWQWAFGGGLSVKLIPVEGQWWNEQLLDSSWVSALVQAGLVGLGTCVGWALWVLRGVLRAPREHRVLFSGLVVFLLGRSVLESGLFDATPAFLCFIAVSLLVEGGSRSRVHAEAAAIPGHGVGLLVPPVAGPTRTPAPAH
ncbi:O-antigen ligase [Geodermatophilus sp. DSM 44513]|uniref:O-antigen ligase family protein n=1 Tax=Geodermatophilus sp. DSM 44513 TaxID=1528104 RepID=UPI00127B23E2|nr:hypothetical protein [Geodermatophilus sp. DSM 44513]WNV76403.1 hypothetical protein RTG05_03820 [Geodermatophilus sp. DSM 44513]